MPSKPVLKGKVYWTKAYFPGKGRKWVRLDEDEPTAMRKYADLTERLKARKYNRAILNKSYEHAVQDWLEDYKQDNDPCSYYRADVVMKYFNDLTPGIETPKQLAPWMLTDFKRQRRKDGVSESTVNREMGPLKAFTTWCVREEHIEINPWRDVPFYTVPQGGEKPKQPYTAAEKTALYEMAADSFELLFLDLGFRQGLRRREMCRLEWAEDIDFKGGSIRAMTRKNKKKPGRWIPMHKETRKHLLLMRKEYPKAERVMVIRAGPATEDYLNKNFRRLLKRSGVSKDGNGGTHRMRHTFLSEMANSRRPVSARAIQELAGHGSLATTEIYMKARDDLKERAVRDIT